MKKGDLVLLRNDLKTKNPNNNIGIILEIRYVNTVIVHWCNGDIHRNELEELILLPKDPGRIEWHLLPE